MEIFLKTLREYLGDPVINLVAALLLGALASILTDRLQKRVKRIWWGIKIKTLDTTFFSATNKLKISYKVNSKSSKDVSHGLSICRFIFWSSGNETLLHTDISENEPLAIFFDKNIEILEIRDLAYSNSSIKPQIISPHIILISFEYLENNQGATFDIVYAGTMVRPYFFGVIKGGKINTKEMSLPEITPLTPTYYLLLSWMKPAQQIIAYRWISTISFIILLWTLLMILASSDNIIETLTSSAVIYILLSLFVYLITLSITLKIAVVPFALREFYSMKD